MAAPSDDDQMAVGHHLARRLEHAARVLRAAVGRNTGSVRARLVRELERIVDEAEKLAKGGG